jgi:hypothetical protein
VQHLLRLPVSLKVLAACLFECTHVLLACVPASMLEMLGRAVLFSILCSLVVLCAPFAPPQDRSTHCVLLVCAPVLFVHAYLAVAGVLLLVRTHARLIYNNVRCADGKRHGCQGGAGPTSDVDKEHAPRASVVNDDDDKLFIHRTAEGQIFYIM